MPMVLQKGTENETEQEEAENRKASGGGLCEYVILDECRMDEPDQISAGIASARRLWQEGLMG